MVWDILADQKRQNAAVEAEFARQQALQQQQQADAQAAAIQKEQNLTGASSPYSVMLKSLLTNPGKSLDTNPIFQWQQQQGEQAVNRAAAAKGQLGSGNRMMALSDYAQKQSGSNFYTLADLYSKLSQDSAGNYRAMYGLDNQKYGIDAQSASEANNLNFKKSQFGYLQDQNDQENQFAIQGWNAAQKDKLRAQYDGLTSGGWHERYKYYDNLANQPTLSSGERGNYANLANQAYAKYQSAPLFY